MAKLTQGTTTLELKILEQVQVSGGDPVFHFFEPISGLPRPIKLGNEPRQWKFNITLTRDELKNLRDMYESGDLCTFVLDDESYSVVIKDLSATDTYEQIEASLTLQEVDVTEVLKVGG